MGNSQDIQEIIREIYNELYGTMDRADVYAALSDDSSCLEFKKIFFEEVMDLIGFSPNDSKVLSLMVAHGINNLVSALLKGGGH